MAQPPQRGASPSATSEGKRVRSRLSRQSRSLAVAKGADGVGRVSRVSGGAVTRLSLVRPSDKATGGAAESAVSAAGEAPPLDDAEVDAARRGEPASWEAAYLAYGKALMGYLVVRLENRDDAAEALSETFLRAIDKASSFRGDAYAFRAWLFTIARHVSTDEHRRRARLVVLPDGPDSEDRSQPSGEELMILREDLSALRDGFARLSKADQEVLWLRVCSGLSAADVGEVLGKRAGAVRMQQMRALEALRGQVNARVRA
jgi:RNA polymerase sigma-70 factor (ECF subfamily)